MTQGNNQWKCGCLKEKYQKRLTDAESWEVNLKEKLREILESDKAPNCFYNETTGSHSLYSTDGIGNSFTWVACPNGCGKMSEKINDCGDETILNHTCSKDKQPTPRERERERANPELFQIQQH